METSSGLFFYVSFVYIETVAWVPKTFIVSVSKPASPHTLDQR